MNKNQNTLQSLTEYCEAHPEQRFWQAVRNWSGYNFVYVSDFLAELDPVVDTFGFQEKDR